MMQILVCPEIVLKIGLGFREICAPVQPAIVGWSKRCPGDNLGSMDCLIREEPMKIVVGWFRPTS